MIAAVVSDTGPGPHARAAGHRGRRLHPMRPAPPRPSRPVHEPFPLSRRPSLSSSTSYASGTPSPSVSSPPRTSMSNVANEGVVALVPGRPVISIRVAVNAASKRSGPPTPAGRYGGQVPVPDARAAGGRRPRPGAIIVYNGANRGTRVPRSVYGDGLLRPARVRQRNAVLRPAAGPAPGPVQQPNGAPPRCKNRQARVERVDRGAEKGLIVRSASAEQRNQRSGDAGPGPRARAAGIRCPCPGAITVERRPEGRRVRSNSPWSCRSPRSQRPCSRQ